VTLPRCEDQHAVLCCAVLCLQTELLDPDLNALEYMMKEYKDIPLEKMRSVVSNTDHNCYKVSCSVALLLAGACMWP
jgi:hypothetical protein